MRRTLWFSTATFGFFGIATLGFGTWEMTSPYFEGVSLGVFCFCVALACCGLAFRFRFDRISLTAFASFVGPIMCLAVLLLGTQYLRVHHPNARVVRIITGR
jgi:hypothetical protein